MNPQLGQRRDDLTPDLNKAQAVAALGAAQGAISQAFGVYLPCTTLRPRGLSYARHSGTWLSGRLSRSAS